MKAEAGSTESGNIPKLLGHHGDGALPLRAVGHHGDGDGDVFAGGSCAASRNCSEEEFTAITWKCRLQRASPDLVHGSVCKLPGANVRQAVEEYHSRGAIQVMPAIPKFLTGRDANIEIKLRFASALLSSCERQAPL